MSFQAQAVGWTEAAARAKELVRRLKAEKIARWEAHRLRKIILEEFQNEKPATGPGWARWSRLTKAEREISKITGMKPLVRRASLWKSISVVDIPGGAFVGVPYTATGRARKPRPYLTRQGKLRRRRGASKRLPPRIPFSPVDEARWIEFGTRPHAIKITPKMMGWLSLLFGWARSDRGLSRGGKKGYVVVSMPARPFLRPAATEWERTQRTSRKKYMDEILKGLE